MKMVEIRDCCKIVCGSTPSRLVDEYWDGEINWFTPKDLSDIQGKYLTESPEKITLLGLKNCSTNILPNNSLLLSSRAPIGYVAINKIECCTNQGFKSLIPDKTLDVEFLYYAIKRIVPLLQSLGNGATFKELSKSTLEKIPIPLPPLETQKKIAAILDTADEYRQKTKALIGKYDQLAQSLFLEMFGDPVRNEKGWELVKFGEYIDILTDYHANGSYEILEKNVKLKNIKDYALMVRTTDLEKNDFVNDVIYVSETAYNFLEKSKVFGGEIIINKIGSAGKVFLMPHLNKPVTLGMNAFLLRFKAILNNIFVYFLLKSKYGEYQIQNRVKGAVTKTIRKDAIREIPIIFPPLTIQNQFAERIQIIESQKQQAQASLQKAEELFNSLLQRAFKGELV